MKKSLFAIFLAVPFVSVAQSDVFDGIINQVMDSITNVRALERGFDAQIMALKAENSLSGPEAGFEYKWPQQIGAGNRWGVEVSQEFEWIGLYGAQRKAAAQLENTRSVAVAGTERWLRYEIADRLLQLIDARKRLNLLNEVAENLEEVNSSMARMLELGQTTVLDCRKAEFELLAIREKIADTQSDYDRLSMLVGFGRIVPSGLDNLTEYPDAPVQLPVLTPEEIEKHVALTVSESNARIERMKNLPSLSVGYVHDFEDGVHFNGLSLGLKLPAYSARKSNLAVRLEAETARMELEQANDRRFAELAADATELSHISKLLEEYERVLAADDYMRLLKKSFDARQITLAQYLLDQNQYLSMRIDYLALLLRYHRLLPALTPFLDYKTDLR